jgi:hypothetical protein
MWGDGEIQKLQAELVEIDRAAEQALIGQPLIGQPKR